jgi:predicted Zn-dependent peptidase
VNFIGQNYTTNRVVIAAAGNVDHEALRAETEARFRFPSSNGTERLVPPTYGTGRRRVFSRETAQTHVCLGLPTFSFAHPHKYALLVVNTILGSGMGSRLFQSVRERRGLAYSIYSMQDYYQDTGFFGVYLATEAAKAAEAVEVVLSEINDIKANILTEDELAAAKSQLKGNMVLSLESSYNRMMRMARHELFLEDFVTLDETVEAINNVSMDDVREMVQQIFEPRYLVLTALGPVDDGLLDQINWSALQ